MNRLLRNLALFALLTLPMLSLARDRDRESDHDYDWRGYYDRGAFQSWEWNRDWDRVLGRSDHEGHEIRGRVIEEREVRLAGGDTIDKVVLLETDDGRRLVVDLGPVAELGRVEIRRGLPITVRGTLADIDDRPVLMARRAHFGERVVNVERHFPSVRLSLNIPYVTIEPNREYDFTGEIIKVTELRVSGDTEPHRVALVRTEDHRRVYVDCGPVSQLGDVDLHVGMRLSLNGEARGSGERPVLVARRLNVNNRAVTIQNTHAPETQEVERQLQVSPSSPETDTNRPADRESQTDRRERAGEQSRQDQSQAEQSRQAQSQPSGASGSITGQTSGRTLAPTGETTGQTLDQTSQPSGQSTSPTTPGTADQSQTGQPSSPPSSTSPSTSQEARPGERLGQSGEREGQPGERLGQTGREGQPGERLGQEAQPGERTGQQGRESESQSSPAAPSSSPSSLSSPGASSPGLSGSSDASTQPGAGASSPSGSSDQSPGSSGASGTTGSSGSTGASGSTDTNGATGSSPPSGTGSSTSGSSSDSEQQ